MRVTPLRAAPTATGRSIDGSEGRGGRGQRAADRGGGIDRPVYGGSCEVSVEDYLNAEELLWTASLGERGERAAAAVRVFYALGVLEQGERENMHRRFASLSFLTTTHVNTRMDISCRP